MITLCVLCLLLTYLNLNLSLKKLFRIFVPSSYFLSMLLIIFLQWKQFLRGRHVMFTVLVNLKRRCSRSIIVLERSAFKRNLRFPTFAWTEIIKENPTVWTQLQRAVQWGGFSMQRMFQKYYSCVFEGIIHGRMTWKMRPR